MISSKTTKNLFATATCYRTFFYFGVFTHCVMTSLELGTIKHGADRPAYIDWWCFIVACGIGSWNGEMGSPGRLVAGQLGWWRGRRLHAPPLGPCATRA